MKNNNGSSFINVESLLLDALCVVDANGRFISVSGACQLIFGYTPEEMVGRQMLELVHPEDSCRTLEAADRIMGGYLQRNFENRYVRKDGSIVHIMWSARWSDADQVRVAVARDITPIRSAGRAQLSGEALAETLPRWRLSSSPPRLLAPNGTSVRLSPQDHTVLMTLATDGERVNRESIIKALGQDPLSYDRRRLDTQMRRLRRRVEHACAMTLPVRTLRAFGFQFYDAIEVCR